MDFSGVELLELLLDEVFLEVGFDEEVSLELEVSSLVSTSTTIFFTDLDELEVYELDFEKLDLDEMELNELALDDFELELELEELEELGELEELETFGFSTFTLAGFCFLVNLTIFPNVLKVNLLLFFFSLLVVEGEDGEDGEDDEDDDEDKDEDEDEDEDDDENDDDKDFGFGIFTSISTLESLEEIELDFVELELEDFLKLTLDDFLEVVDFLDSLELLLSDLWDSDKSISILRPPECLELFEVLEVLELEDFLEVVDFLDSLELLLLLDLWESDKSRSILIPPECL